MGSDEGFAAAAGSQQEPAGEAFCDEALRSLAEGLAVRGLAAPAMVLIELALPFHLLMQQALLVAQPLLRPWLSGRPAHWWTLLEDGEALRRLLCELGATGRPNAKRAPECHRR